MTYIPFSAHLAIVGSATVMHRLDLSEGKFLEPLQTGLDSINACGKHLSTIKTLAESGGRVRSDLSHAHGLLCCAGSDGHVECLDPRQRAAAGSLDVSSALEKVSAGAILSANRHDPRATWRRLL